MTKPEPGTQEWLRLVTASKVPAILGVSPYASPLSQWHEMRNPAPNRPTSRAFTRGHHLEAGIMSWWLAEHQEWSTIEEQPWWPHPNIKDAGATPDAHITSGTTQAVLEIKTVGDWSAWSTQWGQEGTDDVPPHYLVQVQWQMACNPDVHHAYIAALGPALDMRSYRIERDERLIAAMEYKVKKFQDTLKSETPPPLSMHPADLAVIQETTQTHGREGETVIPDALAEAYLDVLAANDASKGIHAALIAASDGAKRLYHPDGTHLANVTVRNGRPSLNRGPKGGTLAHRITAGINLEEKK